MSIHNLATRGNTNELRRLLDRGVNVNARDRYERTPLHLVAEYGHTETVRLLLDRGADPNKRDVFGYTPLHSAAEGGRFETVRLLLDRGADPDALDEDGLTPRDIATGNVHRLFLQVTPVTPRQVRKSRLHDSANGVDPISYNKVPLNNARTIVTNRTNGNDIRHVFHKDTLNAMMNRGLFKHPFTQQAFGPEDVVPLRDALHANQYTLYNNLRNDRTAGDIRRNARPGNTVRNTTNNNTRNAKRQRT